MPGVADKVATGLVARVWPPSIPCAAVLNNTR
jgi:hypothetical protein